MSEKNMVQARLPIYQLQPHPKNIRKEVGDVTELANSIRAQGVMQNLLVVPVPGHDDDLDLFWVVIGNRRLAAAEEADLFDLPCTIAFGLSEQEQIELMLVENLQRSDLTPVEEAQAYEQLVLDFGLSADQIAEKTGVSASTIRRRLKINELDQEEVNGKSFQLSLGDYAALEKVKDVQKRNAVLSAAKSSENLKYLADQAATEEKVKTELLPLIREAAESNGLELVEEKGYNFSFLGSFYRADYPEVTRNRLNTMLKDCGYAQIYADASGPVVYLFGRIAMTESAEAADEAVKERNEHISREELRKQKRKRDHQFMLKCCRAAAGDRQAFIADVVAGKYRTEDSSDSRLLRLWTIIRRIEFIAVGEWELAGYVMNKERYAITDEDMAAVAKWPLWVQMLAAAGLGTNRSDYISDCNGKFLDKNAETLKLFISFLASMGYSVRDQEQEAVLAGTHDCWERR